MLTMKTTFRRWKVLRAIMALARGGQFHMDHVVAAVTSECTSLTEPQVRQEIHTLSTVFKVLQGLPGGLHKITDAASIAANHWRHVLHFETKRCQRHKIKGSPLLTEARVMLRKIGIIKETTDGIENRTEVARAEQGAEAGAEEVEAPQEA